MFFENKLLYEIDIDASHLEMSKKLFYGNVCEVVHISIAFRCTLNVYQHLEIYVYIDYY